jgi:NPCBM/NEW2 domain
VSRLLIVPSALVALFAVVPLAGAGGSAPVKTVEITAGAAAPWVVAGSSVGITGSVKPGTAGLGLALQQRVSGGWTTVATKTVGGSTFSFVAKPKAPGTATFRVVAVKGGPFAGNSAPVLVKVLQWSYLSDQYTRPVAGDLITDPNTAHGVSYDHAISMDAGCYNAWNGDAWADYILNRQYQQFTATIALDDAAPPNSTATWSVWGSGQVLAHGSLANGTVQQVKVPVAGVYRLRLKINVPDPTGAAGCSETFTQVVFGNPKLLGP